MKNLLFILLLCQNVVSAPGIEVAGKGKPNRKGYSQIWKFDHGCNAPESVYFEPTQRILYVSNVAGEPTNKDHRGWIQQLKPNGKVIRTKFFWGLDAPKGMRAHKGLLWVSDIDKVVAINIKNKKIETSYTIHQAKFLNDIAIEPDGTVYVSDTIGSKIYRIHDGKVSLFVEGPEWESPNGLLVDGKELIVASWGLTTDWSTKTPGRLYAIDLRTKKQRFITEKPLGNLDGLEKDHLGNYLVSDWVAGKIYKVTPKGNARELLHGFKNSADIGFDAKSKTLFVPRMGDDQIDAFDLSLYPDY